MHVIVHAEQTRRHLFSMYANSGATGLFTSIDHFLVYNKSII